MQTVNIELQPILSGVLQFVSYMVLAVFAENVVLARALGVSRLIKLVPDHRTQVWDFCLPLLLVMTLSALPGWAAHNLFFPWLRDYLPDWLPMSALRPVVYLTCGVAAMAVTWLLLGLLPLLSGLCPALLAAAATAAARRRTDAACCGLGSFVVCHLPFLSICGPPGRQSTRLRHSL